MFKNTHSRGRNRNSVSNPPWTLEKNHSPRPQRKLTTPRNTNNNPNNMTFIVFTSLNYISLGHSNRSPCFPAAHGLTLPLGYKRIDTAISAACKPVFTIEKGVRNRLKPVQTPHLTKPCFIVLLLSPHLQQPHYFSIPLRCASGISQMPQS